MFVCALMIKKEEKKKNNQTNKTIMAAYKDFLLKSAEPDWKPRKVPNQNNTASFMLLT